MKRSKKQTGSDDAPGAPGWMVTFSDCMTLLLTFFVLLLSFSSFDDNRLFLDMRVIYSRALNSIDVTPKRRPRDAVSYIPPVRHVAKIEKGSETPTSAQESKDASMAETGTADLQDGTVFLIASNNVFWGKGKALSREGRHILDLMASVLKRIPGRVVVSETGSTDVQNSRNFGLPRSWVVMEYLTNSQGLDQSRFSISLTGIVARNSSEGNVVGPERKAAERMIEITILERNTYN